MRQIFLVWVLVTCGASVAAVVHVYERMSAGGVVVQLSDTTFETGRPYVTRTAPAKSGYVFTHWSISTAQAFEPRDAWGRALDAATCTVYEETTLTANYVPKSRDEDGDGLADGHELYWYGSLAVLPTSDTDGDGATFAQELAAGTNPLFPERHNEGAVAYVDGAQWLYNPHGYAPYTIRSEPEGALFATTTAYVKPGSTITSHTGNPSTTAFAYWSLNGVRQADAWGRAVDSFALAMPSNAVELVAVANTSVDDKWKLYWYGTLDVAMASDTDGDGRTFAEELAAGTSPLMPERHEEGPVAYVDGPLWQYNPYNIQPYTIRSDPEGALFATTSQYVRAGTEMTSYTCRPNTSNFAYWTLNGVEQRDAWGRAVDTVSFPMPTNAVTLVAKATADADARQSLYWYGNTTTAMTSDTDGDGRTFAEELAAGTNPLMPERHEEGPVTYTDTPVHELNLQVYEQMRGAVVEGGYEPLFYSPIAGNEAAVRFDGAVTPVVADVNGDGLFDLIVRAASSTNVFLNVGSSGNPEFVRERDIPVASTVDLQMNSIAKLSAFALDVPATDALSATTNGATLLVSDADGRIWYYQQSNNQTIEQSNNSYVLQHKVWGGSFAGFAKGLKLAAVDWDDDGDLDCLCGTADGRLMLLRDPKVGRPTNVKALAGVDNVLLTWDPNAQSRIRGYKVYRDDAHVASPVLPTHRDYPGTIQAYDYRVSSVSRFYTAGNSTPTVSESPATEAVHVELGRVSLHWTDASAQIGGQVSVMLSVDNSANLSPEMTITLDYDRSKLALLKTVPSALFEGGRIAPGAGRLYEYVFDVVAAEPGETEVRVASAAMKGVGGAYVMPIMPTANAKVSIAAAEKPAYKLGDLDGNGVVDDQDLRLLAKLKDGARKYTAEQLKAGDFNGNGKLDNADYQALRARVLGGS